MSDDVVRLSVIGQILQRRWRLLLVVAALGAVAGATASLLWPPSYESSSQVLVQGEPGKDRVRSEAQIAMSLVVLDRAATRLNWGIEGSGLRDSVTAAVADGTVIEIRARAGSPDRARQLAEQVTQHYVAFSTEILTQSVRASGEVLTARKDSLPQQIADIDRRISELQGSAGLPNTGNELRQLGNDRTAAVKELNDLDERIAQAQATASREHFSIIDPPAASSAPVTSTRLELMAGGAGLAAVLGVFVLVVVRHADRRLRRDSDIAAALGAPVLGTVAAPAEAAVTSVTNPATHGATNGLPDERDAAGRRSWLQRLLHDGAPWDVSQLPESGDQSLEQLRYRRVLARLRATPDESVRLLVVVVDDDECASRAVARLADQTRSTPAAVLSVVPVCAARPTVADSPDVSGVLVVVTSGTRTSWELLAIAQACRDAGHPVSGVLIVLPRVDEEGAADSGQLRRRAGVGPA